MIDRPTLEDVARLAGVHKGTASRALNAATQARVQPTTAKRIQAAARELGYAPNTFAQSLRRQQSRSVGVLIPDLTNPFFPPIVRGIEDVLAGAGFTALLASTDNDHDRERRLFQTLTARHVDGFIVGTATRDHPLLREAHAAGIKVVLAQRLTDEALFSSALADDAAGVDMVLQHLVAAGHRRIGHVAGPLGISVGQRRARAFRESAADLGVPVEDLAEVMGDELSIEGGMRAAETLLDTAPRTTAIFAANDLMAVGVLRTLLARGISCPGEMSVAGFNDMPLAGDLAPGLTTVRVPLNDIGREAGRLLLSELGHHGEPPTVGRRQILLPVELVVRDSTGSAPAP